MTKNNRVVLVLSGGLDSTTLLYDLVLSGNEVYAISFNYSQRHSKELLCAKASCEKLDISHKIVDISAISELLQGSSLTSSDIDTPHGRYDSENMRKTVVPNRNMIMISLATAYAISIKANKVYYGSHSGDHEIYFDCRPVFVDKLNEAIKVCDEHKVELVAPYLHFDKGDIVKLGTVLGVDYGKTWSCYDGKEMICGECGACNERQEAFAKAGVDDPLVMTL